MQIRVSVNWGIAEVIENDFRNDNKLLTQERISEDKIHSLDEPQTACKAKENAHKAYEFGTKVVVVRGRKTGLITSVKRFSGNSHFSTASEESLAQSLRVSEAIRGTRPAIAIICRGEICEKCSVIKNIYPLQVLNYNWINTDIHFAIVY